MPKLSKADRKARVSSNEANRRRLVALARKRELETDLLEGTLVRLQEINAFIAGMILRAKDILQRIGPELKDRLAQESDPVKIEQMITEEVNRALSQLSEYKPAKSGRTQ